MHYKNGGAPGCDPAGRLCKGLALEMPSCCHGFRFLKRNKCKENVLRVYKTSTMKSRNSDSISAEWLAYWTGLNLVQTELIGSHRPTLNVICNPAIIFGYIRIYTRVGDISASQQAPWNYSAEIRLIAAASTCEWPSRIPLTSVFSSSSTNHIIREASVKLGKPTIAVYTVS